MFQYTFGDIGSGKSLTLAKKIISCLRESIKIEKKYHMPIREIWVNIPIREDIMKKYQDRLHYWENPFEMIFKDYPYNRILRRDFDCFIDELAGYLAADKWRECPEQIRKFFARHRKRGIRIFGNTQDYMMLDINARRMATEVYKVRKLIGSPDPSPTLPPIKHIWGIIITRQVDKRSVEQDVLKAEAVGWPEITWIGRDLTDFYDMTREVIDMEEPELVHKMRRCKICGQEHIYHDNKCVITKHGKTFEKAEASTRLV